ncbi:amidohydrolase [Purpureocillium lavendulum]|uniref:Amidohydrolase n=1 Tax=Purpureocillium lavendulum TaxID=1247861 RepID=A0AB34FRG6_9HYPO|nr:amidohydrolase [Purpureocillium lavendulum]
MMAPDEDRGKTKDEETQPSTTEPPPPQQHRTDVNAGSAVYSPWLLSVYDALVLGLSNTYVWRCPTAAVLLPLFESAVVAGPGSHHLDVGVGTGFYPATAIARHRGESGASAMCEALTLVDANPVALATAHRRVLSAAARASSYSPSSLSSSLSSSPSSSPSSSSPPIRVTAVLADATRPLAIHASSDDEDGDDGGRPFTSATLFYLLHCIALRPTDAKAAAVLDAVRSRLAPGATLAGATIIVPGGRCQRDDEDDDNDDENDEHDEHQHQHQQDCQHQHHQQQHQHPQQQPSAWWLARALAACYNRHGIFANADDDPRVLERALRARFDAVEIWFVGAVMLFRARQPQDPSSQLPTLPDRSQGPSAAAAAACTRTRDNSR